uniref:Uncharacterized protein n=1 Tax=Siphoviridae sp. cttFh17 TaxID=2826491 RepID=A0A8S5NJE3_9CAUD|nr:MAG TPA: hypothetical protein [Siphoviridae sp. cttFh17]
MFLTSTITKYLQYIFVIFYRYMSNWSSLFLCCDEI